MWEFIWRQIEIHLHIISYAVCMWPNTGLYGTMIIRIGRGEAETNTDNQSPI